MNDRTVSSYQDLNTVSSLRIFYRAGKTKDTYVCMYVYVCIFICMPIIFTCFMNKKINIQCYTNLKRLY